MLVPLEKPNFSIRFGDTETDRENEADELCSVYTNRLKGLMRQVLPKLEKWTKEYERLANWSLHRAKTNDDRVAISRAASDLLDEIKGMGWGYHHCPSKLEPIYDMAAEIYDPRGKLYKSIHSWRHGKKWTAIYRVCKDFKESVARIQEQCEQMKKYGCYQMHVGSPETSFVKDTLRAL